MTRAKLFIDSQNIKRGAKNSLGIIVDFMRLRKLIREKCGLQNAALVGTAIYEGVYPPWVEGHQNPKIRRLGLVRNNVLKEMSFLHKQGFETVVKELRYESGIFFQKGIDIQIAVDMMMATFNGECEVLILASGDEDFMPVVNLLNSAYSPYPTVVWLVSFGANISSRMIKMANRFIRLDDYKNRIKAARRS